MHRFFLCLAGAVATILAAACGSGTNDGMSNTPPPSATPTVTLSASNIDLVARAAGNAAISSSDVAKVNPTSAAKGSLSTVRAQSLQQLLLGLTRELVVDRVVPKGAPISSTMPTTQSLITRTDPCSAGGSVTSTLDDRDNSGAASSGDVLAVTFVQCKPSATDLIDGSVAATYSVVQQAPVFAMATVTYSHLQASSTDGTFSIDGSFSYSLSQTGAITSVQLSIGANGLTAAVTGSNYTDTVTLGAGYTVTASRNPLDLPPGSSIPGSGMLIVNGAISATSIGGTIVISTPVPIKKFDIDPFPRQGQVLVRGMNNSLLALTVLSTTTVLVQLDANGDGVFEVSKNVSWFDLI
jgi:hypothetical protein